LSALRFDAATRRLVREGVPGEVSSFDVRALGAATALRAAHGGEVVALTMGPPPAREALVHCLALGADRAVHLLDPLLAGSATLEGPLPAVGTAAEDLAEERFPKKAEREAAAAKPIATLGVADLGLAPGDVGLAGSPTEVAAIEPVDVTRRGEVLAGESPEALARALREKLVGLGALDRAGEAGEPLPPRARV